MYRTHFVQFGRTAGLIKTTLQNFIKTLITSTQVLCTLVCNWLKDLGHTLLEKSDKEVLNNIKNQQTIH